MKLTTRCPQCTERLSIPSFWIGDRLELAKSKGTEIPCQCPRCNYRFDAHVDDVRAEHDNTVTIIGILTLIPAIAFTYILWNVGFIAYLTLAFPIIATTSARQSQRTKINRFNLMYYDSKRLRAK